MLLVTRFAHRPVLFMKMKVNRRQFVRYASLGVGGVAAASFGVRVGTRWWNQPSSGGYKQLSDVEVEIVEAIASAMFPGESSALYAKPMPNGVQVGLVKAFDEYLNSIDRSTANLLRMLLHAIDDGGVVADLGLTRFRHRSLDDRIEILDAWDRSFFATRRGAFRSLKILLSTAYCEHPSVLDAAGIHFSCGGVA